MRLYETVYILRPDLEEDRTNQIVELMENVIKRGGGVVKNLERWGKKRLAYRVKKERYGYYVLMHFEGNSDLMKELERNYRLSDEVMKYLTIRIKKGEPVKIVMEPEEFQEYTEKPAGTKSAVREEEKEKIASKEGEAEKEEAEKEEQEERE